MKKSNLILAALIALPAITGNLLIPAIAGEMSQTQDLSQLKEQYQAVVSGKDNSPELEKIRAAEQELDKQKVALWTEYLNRKKQEQEAQDAKVVGQNAANAGSIDPFADPSKDEEKRFTCMVISDLSGAQLSQKTNFAVRADSVAKDLVFAIDNANRDVYINDGLDFKYLRVRPNIFQRYMPYMQKNDVLETWAFDMNANKAFYSQIKIGDDVGDSIKSMVGNIKKVEAANDCNPYIPKQ